jgi:hypothetical protein
MLHEAFNVLHRLFCRAAVLLLLSLSVLAAGMNRSNPANRALENYGHLVK